MSTPSRSASAPKAKTWSPEQVAGWVRGQPLLPTHVGRFDPGKDASSHQRLCQIFLRLRPDPTPLPLSPREVPLLP